MLLAGASPEMLIPTMSDKLPDGGQLQAHDSTAAMVRVTDFSGATAGGPTVS